MSTVYLNGTYLPIHEAKISVLDRGFLFGDGVYEVLPIYSGKLFQYPLHLERLQKGLKAIQFQNTFDCEQLAEIFQGIIECNKENNISGIYLQVTRGASENRNHIIPETYDPTVFVCPIHYHTYSHEEKLEGVKVITYADIRWQRCDIKAITLLPNILAKTAAFEYKSEEAVLIKGGYALEGSSSNVFAVLNNKIITAPANHEILNGITRQVTIKIIKNLRLEFEERKITEQELFTADEIWLTSTTKEIMPVTQVNNKTVKNGQAGPIWHIINDEFQKLKCKAD